MSTMPSAESDALRYRVADAPEALSFDEVYKEHSRDQQGNMRTQTRERLVSRDVSSTPIAIDDGTGVVLVDLVDLDVDQPVLTLERNIDDGDSLAEDLLKTIHVHAQGRRGGVVWGQSGEWLPISYASFSGMWWRWLYGTWQAVSLALVDGSFRRLGALERFEETRDRALKR